MIAKIEYLEPASFPSALGWRRRKYRSPNQKWTLVLHGSSEWAMGATGWKASLLWSGMNVSWRHRAILGIAGKQGFQAPDNFQPWAIDSRVLALITWKKENPVYLCDIKNNRCLEIQTGTAFPGCAQFAPDTDRLLISFTDSGRVYDQRGVSCFNIPWQVADSELPFVSWTRGTQILWVGREVDSSQTVLRAYSGLDGTLLATQHLEPADVVPYDRDLYASISRPALTLRIGPHGAWGDGSLLNRWSQIRFDRSSSRLLLSVFRPVSQPYRGRHGLVCDVAERWVAATLESGRDPRSGQKRHLS